jgi:DNA-binding response OmpR family regulator
MKTILCVEDDPKILYNNSRALAQNGYKVMAAANLAQARELLADHAPDGIVLDIMLPDGNGLEYLRELREQGNAVPVLMLTAWNTSADIAKGLDFGADDYIGKPFAYDVLLSRVRKMLDHAQRVPERVSVGALTLDVLSGRAFLDGADMLLAKKEFALLLLFVQSEGKLMSDEYIYEKIWKQPMHEDAQAVRNTVSRLRKRLSGSGLAISSEYGEGYRLGTQMP